jgi:hypothetical protein
LGARRVAWRQRLERAGLRRRRLQRTAASTARRSERRPEAAPRSPSSSASTTPPGTRTYHRVHPRQPQLAVVRRRQHRQLLGREQPPGSFPQRAGELGGKMVAGLQPARRDGGLGCGVAGRGRRGRVRGRGSLGGGGGGWDWGSGRGGRVQGRRRPRRRRAPRKAQPTCSGSRRGPCSRARRVTTVKSHSGRSRRPCGARAHARGSGSAAREGRPRRRAPMRPGRPHQPQPSAPAHSHPPAGAALSKSCPSLSPSGAASSSAAHSSGAAPGGASAASGRPAWCRGAGAASKGHKGQRERE